MDVSENSGFPPKSSSSIGFSILNHPFWGTPIFGNTHIIADCSVVGANYCAKCLRQVVPFFGHVWPVCHYVGLSYSISKVFGLKITTLHPKKFVKERFCRKVTECGYPNLIFRLIQYRSWSSYRQSYDVIIHSESYKNCKHHNIKLSFTVPDGKCSRSHLCRRLTRWPNSLCSLRRRE